MRQHPLLSLFSSWGVIGVVLLTGCGDSLQPSESLPATTFDYRTLPRQISSLDLGFWVRDWNFSVDGDQAAVASYSDIAFIDFTDRHHPRLTNQWRWQEGIRGLALRDSLLLLIDDSLSVLDMAVPEAAPVAMLGFPAGERPYFLQAICGAFWVATERTASHALYRIELPEPSSPTIVAETPISGAVRDLAFENALLLVGASNGAVFLDVSDPGRMETITTIAKGGAVGLANGYAYVGGSAFGSRGLTVLDIRDPAHPVEVGSTLTPYTTHNLHVFGRYVFANSGQSVDVIDMIDRRQPVVRGNIPAEARSSGTWFLARDDRLWLAGAEFREFEFEETFGAPLLAERGLLGCWGCFAQLENGHLYWYRSREIHSLPLYGPDLSGPLDAVPFPLSFGDHIQQVDRGHIVSTHDNSLRMTNLTSGEMEWDEDLGEKVVWARIEADRLFAITRNFLGTTYRLHVFDVGDPRRPRLSGTFLREGDPYADFLEAIVAGDRVIVLARLLDEVTLDIIGVERASEPRLLSETHTSDLNYYDPTAMAVHRNHLYIDGGVLLAFDIRDPASPRLLSSQPGHRSEDIVVVGRTMYSASRLRMDVYDISESGSPRPIAVQGWVSTNTCERLLTDERHLIALLDNGIHVYPLHGTGH